MLSTKIVSAYLNKIGINAHWMDARDAILTDNSYRESIVDWSATLQRCQDKVKPLLEKGDLVITQGFIVVLPKILPPH